MADQDPAGNADTANAAAAQNIVFNFDKIYLKDMSIEIPHSPAIFLETDPPALETQLNVDANNFADGMYEVIVTATVTTKVKDKVMFLVEVRQAGIFEVRNFPQDQIDPLLGIHCAGVLFPYLRANVADIVVRAGFPALHLPNVNFEAFYAQRIQQLEEARRNGQPAPAPTATTLQ
jgi:preprotein translocase subunit SecB